MKCLIFKANQLGDNVVYLPVVQHLAGELAAEVTVITTTTAAHLYEGFIPEEKVWIVERDEMLGLWKQPMDFLKMVMKIRRAKFDAILVPFDQGKAARILAQLSGVKSVVMVRNEKARVPTWAASEVVTEAATRMPEQDWASLRRLGDMLKLKIPDRPPAPDFSHLTKGAPKKMERRLFIHPGASRDYKKWELVRFVEVANIFIKEDWEVLWAVQGEEAESKLGPDVRRIPQGSLREFISILASCGCFLGNNSGPMNLASSLGIHCVILSGPSPPKWDPYWHREKVQNLRLPDLECQPCDTVNGPINKCLNEVEPMACMKRWSVGQVVSRIRESSSALPDE